jgi:2-iminobutanoate/2-iminopropanoate deaminase
LQNINGILEASGSSISNSVKLTVFLTDLSRFAELNEVFLEFFSENPPARSALEVSKLPLGVDVEIECIAIKGS